ncbi:phytanoyl-CoA dioxygenase family protein [Acidovorax sp. Leaf78]|uniref:phytanoyl-CoA dioxygenase family protein n=1 Tax=Acidovorax sp. Leaf78 TaxID=1736237 RepID=UPI000A7C44F5|nr:phytanoyl-CoA dioxygenase family protein [Acidovorax sp. Leaf78]
MTAPSPIDTPAAGATATALLEAQGFVLVPGVLQPAECSALAHDLNANMQAPDRGGHRAHSASGGQRDLLNRPWCQALARRLQQCPALADLLLASAVAVQCTYFEKTPARNWLVPLHQDLSIPVAERVDAPDLNGWSDKDGTLFVQPPAPLLQTLLAVRLHIDPCHADDGPLRVVPASHTQGVLAADAARALRDRAGDVPCLADAGTALVMRPLLLHASCKTSGTSKRRVLHFVFGPAQLPWGLRWRGAVVD